MVVTIIGQPTRRDEAGESVGEACAQVGVLIRTIHNKHAADLASLCDDRGRVALIAPTSAQVLDTDPA